MKNRIKKSDEIIRDDCLEVLKKIPFEKFKNKRVLVTGGTGLLGRYIVRTIGWANSIQRNNCKILAVGRHISKSDRDFGKKYGVTYVQKDISKPFSMPGRFDFIFHAAGYAQPAKFIANPLATIRINIDATANLLELAKKSNGVFVFFSSAEIYGEMAPGMKSASEEYQGLLSTSNPRAVYGEAKRLAETLIAAHVRQFGTKGKIVRISHTYGPGITYDDSRVFGDFMRKAAQDGRITMLDAGTSTKTYGYVADVIAMILSVALLGEEMVYNVGGKDSASIRQLAEYIAKLTNAQVYVPEEISKKAHIGHDPKVVRLNIEKIKRLNNKITFTPLQEGLKKMIAWNVQK
jgi:dTDP-glucose 4,6-dehydratase/UDP-glucuronate decarboxylase